VARQIVSILYQDVTGNQQLISLTGAERGSIITESKRDSRGLHAFVPKDFIDSVDKPEFPNIGQCLGHVLLLPYLMETIR
jgi:GMP synthase-like glutamine amidotransferase